MNKLLLLNLFLCLLSPLLFAQVNETITEGSPSCQAMISSASAGRGLGDLLFTLEVENITGDLRCIGLEFDDENFWVTGASDFTKAYLYKISWCGELLGTYPQPPANWGTWGWRDLTWDGEYLYAGSDAHYPGYIAQIDPATGSVTGVYYGPFPINPCRALAYDEREDCFWTASFSSSIYQCFKDGSSISYTNPGLALYGAAVEASDPDDPMLWWCSQDGSGSLFSEFSLKTKTFTGKTFDPGGGGIAGGSCAFDMGGGVWVLAVIMQAAPDYIAVYDLGTAPITLTSDVNAIDAGTGGSANLSLAAGGSHGGRSYGIFGSLSGSIPGTPLPGGLTTLSINWDWFTNILIGYDPSFTFGSLNASGNAAECLTVPGPIQLTESINMRFAFCLAGPPWDFGSNWVNIVLKKP
jgi:hypothetical protein